MNFGGSAATSSSRLPPRLAWPAEGDLPRRWRAALCELVERDAFVICWLNRLPAPRIEPGRQRPRRPVRRHYARFELDVRAST